MSDTRALIDSISSNKKVDARNQIDAVLKSKAGEAINGMYASVAQSMFGQADEKVEEFSIEEDP